MIYSHIRRSARGGYEKGTGAVDGGRGSGTRDAKERGRERENRSRDGGKVNASKVRGAPDVRQVHRGARVDPLKGPEEQQRIGEEGVR